MYKDPRQETFDHLDNAKEIYNTLLIIPIFYISVAFIYRSLGRNGRFRPT